MFYTTSLWLFLLKIKKIFFYRYKERNNRIVNIDMNQRLVQQQQNQPFGQKDQKSAAFAKQKARERERRELREHKYTESSNNNRGHSAAVAATRSPFESQESNASFPLQTFQSTFAQIMPTNSGTVEPLETAATAATASQQMREHEVIYFFNIYIFVYFLNSK